MTKKRASIRGRGAEILFGDPSEVEVEPRAPGEEPALVPPAPGAAEAPDEEPVPEEPESDTAEAPDEELAPEESEEPEAPDESPAPEESEEPEASDEEPAPEESEEPKALDQEPAPEEPAAAETSAAEGEEAKDEEELAASEEVQGAPPDADAGLEWDEDEIEKALREEALDGAPPPTLPSPDVQAPPEVAPPTTPEMETAVMEEAEAAEAPPEPVAEPPPPTLEETMEEKELEQEAALYAPPPPEVDSVSAGAVPPRPEPRYFDMDPEAMLARDIQEPEQPVEIITLPERPLTDAEKAEILARLGEEWIQALEAEIDDAYEDVRRGMGENEAATVAAYNRLLQARDILVMRKVDQLAQAEYYLELVRARIKRASQSESAARKYQWPLLAWGLFWGVAFLILLILLGHDWLRNIVFPARTADSLLELNTLIPAMLWGGVGGSVAVLYSLFKHIGRRDFDSQYLISYVGKPFLGLVIGATVYMVFNLVIRALGIFPAGMQTAEGGGAPTVAPGVVYLVAWASGFKEDRILSLIDQVMAQLFGGDKEKEEAEGDAES